jgi:hypothetical protein
MGIPWWGVGLLIIKCWGFQGRFLKIRKIIAVLGACNVWLLWTVAIETWAHMDDVFFHHSLAEFLEADGRTDLVSAPDHWFSPTAKLRLPPMESSSVGLNKYRWMSDFLGHLEIQWIIMNYHRVSRFFLWFFLWKLPINCGIAQFQTDPLCHCGPRTNMDATWVGIQGVLGLKPRGFQVKTIGNWGLTFQRWWLSV